MSITQEQIQELQAKVQKLVADKQAADDATAASSAAHTALTKAMADAGAADTVEAQADGLVNMDLTDVQGFINVLAGGPPPAPPPAPQELPRKGR